METNFINLTPAQLRRAAGLKERIDALTGELGQIFGDGSGGSSDTGQVKSQRGRHMSAAGRARIAAAARARWAKVRASKGQDGNASKSSDPANTKRRTMSAAARAKIAAAARARWARVKAGKA